jgi:hypothetical protein
VSNGKVVVIGALIAVLSLVWAKPLGSDQVTQDQRATFEHPALIVQPTQTFPDPAITWDPATHLYRLFDTETLWSNVPEYTSKSETGPWTFVGDALPTRPAWSKPGFDMWAPEVADIHGTWTMWGSSKLALFHRINCLYRATAKTAAGPYTVDHRTHCFDVSLDGDIDPSMSDNDGTWFLTYKINGNTFGKPTQFVAVRLAPNGLPVGPHHVVLVSDQAWEDGMIEAPSMVQNQSSGRWWVVFSTGNFSDIDPTYEIVAAPCKGVAGPCNINQVVDLVSTNEQGKGPGEESVSIDRYGQAWMPYNPSGPFHDPYLRVLAQVKLEFNLEGLPYVVTP